MVLGRLAFVLLTIFLLQHEHVEGKIYDKCGFARELQKLNIFPLKDLNDVVCIAQFESGFDTCAVNKIIHVGGYEWGVFQINEMWSCDPHRPGFRPHTNGCNISCESLLSLEESARCVKDIYDRPRGFAASDQWNIHCQGRHYDLSDCHLQQYENSNNNDIC